MENVVQWRGCCVHLVVCRHTGEVYYFLFSCSTSFADVGAPYSIDLVVMNSIDNTPDKTYSAQIAYEGVLISSMMKLEMENTGFQ